MQNEDRDSVGGALRSALSRRLANPVVSLPGTRKRVLELPAPGREKEHPHVEPAELLLLEEGR